MGEVLGYTFSSPIVGMNPNFLSVSSRGCFSNFTGNVVCYLKQLWSNLPLKIWCCRLGGAMCGILLHPMVSINDNIIAVYFNATASNNSLWNYACLHWRSVFMLYAAWNVNNTLKSYIENRGVGRNHFDNISRFFVWRYYLINYIGKS